MVGGGEVFKDGETWADAVSTEVGEGAEGYFLVLEDKASNEFRVEFYDYWGGGGGFLGGNNKGTGEGEVE